MLFRGRPDVGFIYVSTYPRKSDRIPRENSLQRWVVQAFEANIPQHVTVIGGDCQIARVDQLTLQAQESKLIEELLVGDLSSDGAKDFLAQIPTLEGLIPLPAGANGKLAALESGDE